MSRIVCRLSQWLPDNTPLLGRVFDRHRETCLRCQADAARLRGVGDVLFSPQPNGLSVGMDEQSSLWRGIRTESIQDIESVGIEFAMPAPFPQLAPTAGWSMRAGQAGSPTTASEYGFRNS